MGKNYFFPFFAGFFAPTFRAPELSERRETLTFLIFFTFIGRSV